MSSIIYAGSFDPFHYGHLNIVRRLSLMFDKVVVLVADNPKKTYTLELADRCVIANRTCKNIPNVDVKPLPPGLLVTDYAKQIGCKVIAKGVRTLQDVEYERMIHEVTVSQERGVDTMLLFASPKDQHISSSAVKELVSYNADVSNYVPLDTKQTLERRQNGQIIIGITGTIGSGKSTVAKFIQGHAKELFFTSRDEPITVVDFDNIIDELTYGDADDDNCWVQELRARVTKITGLTLRTCDGKPNRKAMAAMVFSDSSLRAELTSIYKPYLTASVRKRLSGKKGLILLDAPLLIESGLSDLCNHRVILTHAKEETLIARLTQRYGSELEAIKRLACQFNAQEKEDLLLKAAERDGCGQIFRVCTDGELSFSPPDPHKVGYFTWSKAKILELQDTLQDLIL